MRSRISLIGLAIIFLLLCWGCERKPDELQIILHDINKKFDKINSYDANYYVKNDSTIESYGKISFIKPDILRIDSFAYPGKESMGTLFFDKNYEWWYMPRGHTAIKQKLKASYNPKYRFLSYGIPDRDIISIKYLGRRAKEGLQFIVLEVEVGDKKSRYINKYNFYIDPENGLIHQFSYFDRDSNKNVIQEFKDYKINIPIKEEEIKLNLPKDVFISEIK